MAKKSEVKEFILEFAKKHNDITSNRLFLAAFFSKSQIDAKLLELFDEGVLTREKKTSTWGSNVYHYSLTPAKPAPKFAPVDNDAEIDEDEDYAFDEDDDNYWNDEADYEDEGDDEECNDDAPAAEITGTKVLFIVRRDDIYGFSYGAGGQKFARTLARFDKYHNRWFEKHGNAVISIFATDASLDQIASELQAALPEINFGIATTVEESVAIIQTYSNEAGQTFYVDSYRNFADRQVNKLTQCGAPSPAYSNGQKAEVKAEPAKTITAAPPTSIIEKLAQDGSAYAHMSMAELGEFFQKVAKFYLENN